MSYCLTALDPYSENLCEESFGGGISAIVFFPNYLPIDPSDGVEIQEMINLGEAIRAKDLKIGIPEASGVTRTSYISCKVDPTITYDRTFTLMDQNVIDANIAFYNSLKRRTSIAGALLYECDADRVTFVTDSISVSGSRLVADDKTDSQHFSMLGSWRNIDDPNIFPAPANIF